MQSITNTTSNTTSNTASNTASNKEDNEVILEDVENIISDSEFAPFSTIFPSKESYYYKKI